MLKNLPTWNRKRSALSSLFKLNFVLFCILSVKCWPSVTWKQFLFYNSSPPRASLHIPEYWDKKKKKNPLEKGKNRIQLSYYFMLCVYVCVRVLAVLPTEVWRWLKWECFPIGYKCCYFYLWEEGFHFYNLISPYALECKMLFRYIFFFPFNFAQGLYKCNLNLVQIEAGIPAEIKSN